MWGSHKVSVTLGWEGRFPQGDTEGDREGHPGARSLPGFATDHRRLVGALCRRPTLSG